MSNRGHLFNALAAACLLAGAAPAQAHDTDLNTLAAQSRAVVQTRVTQVAYTQSKATPGQPAVPHTVVTFEVVRPLAGSLGTSSFSLRFIGGPDGQGRFMRASHVPVFQPGDEDILFVRHSGEKGCALAGCVDGRFRLANGVVHDGTGVPVRGIESGHVVASGEVPAELRTLRYPRPDFDQLMQRPGAREQLAAQGLSVAEARRLYDTQAPAMVEMAMISGKAEVPDRAHGDPQAADRPEAPARAMAADSFAAHVATLAVPRSEGATAFVGMAPDAHIPAPSGQAARPARTPR